jgi:hypothetical protein
MNDSPYRLIFDPGGTWFIVGKKTGDEIEVVYEGKTLHVAFRAILDDLGIEVPSVQRKRCDENYSPKAKDWETQ